jgi:hypothetical protein
MRGRYFLPLAAVVAPALAAQTAVDTAAKEATRLKAVEIHTSDVFPKSESRGLIPTLLNGLHITTRPGVVRRELLLSPGERFDSAKAAETERGLRALQIFRRVRVDSVRTDSGLVLRVETQDAFTTRVEGSIEGSDQSSTWWIALNELNLFGTATRVGVRYRKTPDRDAITTSFQRSRLVDGRIGVSALYDARSDGRMVYGVMWLPYFSLASPASWYVSGEERSERIFRFFEGAPRATDTLQRRFWLARAGIGRAVRSGSGGYLRVGVDGQLRRDDYSVDRRQDTLAHTVTGALTSYVRWRAARYLVSRDFVGIGRQEDVDLSTEVELSLGVAPTAFGYRDDGVVPGVRIQSGTGWRGGFARVIGSALGRITDAGKLDSGSVHLGGMMVLKPTARQMAVFHAARGWQKNPMPGGEFDLGLGLGPRGFRQHFFTGDRAFLIGAEYRYLLTDNFLRTAGIGLAGFAEYGGAWYSGAPRRTGYSAGIGLRFGLTVASDLSPARLDLAYNDGDGLVKGGWRIAFGKGFVFSTAGRLDR